MHRLMFARRLRGGKMPIGGLSSPSTTTATATAATAAAGEAASARARGRRERLSEPGREISDRERGGARPEVSVRADPVDGARVVDLLGHVELGALQDSLR